LVSKEDKAVCNRCNQVLPHFSSRPSGEGYFLSNYQIVTSVAANYRASCRGRSQAEFYSKICIVVEEADESLFWLEMIEGARFKIDYIELKRLQNEADEILAISSKAKGTSGGKKD